MAHQVEETPATDGPTWFLVVAIANNGVIGRNGSLPWRLRTDLQRFKRMTMGHCLLMGRRTFESIGRPLPGRQTVVLTRRPVPDDWPDTICVAGDLDEVNRIVEAGRHVMVVGGSEVYAQAVDRCSQLWITRVLADVQGNVRFPDIDWDAWELTSSEKVPAGPHDQWPTEFQIWCRREAANGVS